MSAKRMALTVLATELAAAVVQDETPASKWDLGAGMYGPNVSAWLHGVANSVDATVTATRTAQAYKWAYEYLQERMRSIGRDGWAEDCDGEIAHRIAGPNAEVRGA